MRVMAQSKFITKEFETVEEAAEFAKVTKDEILKAIETGKPIMVGIRDYTFDECLKQ